MLKMVRTDRVKLFLWIFQVSHHDRVRDEVWLELHMALLTYLDAMASFNDLTKTPLPEPLDFLKVVPIS